MTVHSFGGIAYPTPATAMRARVFSWVSADGLNECAEVVSYIDAKSDKAMADEYLADLEPDAARPDRDDVIAAFAELRAMDGVFHAI